MVGEGNCVTVSVVVAVAAAQPPAEAIKLVMVYVPAALAARSISPVEVLTKTKPEGVALNTPELAPAENVGAGLVALLQ